MRPIKPVPALTPRQVSKFWIRVDRTGDPSDCWNWIGYVGREGYGVFSLNAWPTGAHRIAYTLVRGEIPANLTLDHLCRNRRCLNPDHLEPVTQRENTMRGLSPLAFNAKKTHCPKGHEYTLYNTLKSRDGRTCRECSLQRNREWYAREKARAPLGCPLKVIRLLSRERNSNSKVSEVA